MIRIANAPVSYGAFELTVGVLPNVPGPDEVLGAIELAGYEGTELGPPGYLGDHGVLRERLARHSLALAGAFVPLRLGEPDVDFGALEVTLDLIEGTGARPVLADAGPPRPVDWSRLAGDVARAAEQARARGLEPTFHHHMGTAVQTPAEIEHLLARTDVGLLLDTGHLLAAGGDPLQALGDWHSRIDHLHVKDVRLDVLRAAPDWDTAWRAGVFCELGTGDVDLASFFAELHGYDGWLVVEQDWVPRPDESPGEQIAAQVRNRQWLEGHAGL